MLELKNILLVSGSGRNCGKTTVACNIIRQLSKTELVVGLKISPHFHPSENKQQIVAEEEGYRIFRETDKHSGKDSSRMLNAGASEVFFIQCTDGNLHKVYEYLKKIIPPDQAVVCESGSFASVYQPGLHLLIKGINADDSKKSYLSNLKLADVILTQKDLLETQLYSKIVFLDKKWTIKKEPVLKPALKLPTL